MVKMQPAARHFQYRLSTFFKDVLKSKANPLGEIAIRIEFQSRGSPCVLWAPLYGNSDICAFIDQYVTCAIPAIDGKLKELVLMLQQHRHSSYCKRNRFNFPHPPSTETIIAEQCLDPEECEQAQKTVLPECCDVDTLAYQSKC